MKITTTCSLGLLMIICSIATAQQVVPPPSLPCSGSPTRAVIDWAQFHFVPCHTGFNPYEFVLSPATVGNLGLHWQYWIGLEIFSSPAVVNGVVYVGANTGTYALHASTGDLLWQYTTGNTVYSSPAVANGIVYFTSNDSNVYALNANRGLSCGSTRPGTRAHLRRRWRTVWCMSDPMTTTFTP